jgi:hypothetical protein
MDSKVTKTPKLYQSLSMAKAKKVANELMKFVKDNKLSGNIAGKEYLYVEAWQFVGETQMGLTQVILSCEPVPTEKSEIKYKAVAEIFNQQGTVISRGFAFASSLEKGRNGSTKWKDEYAVASMAQTRAIGKAYRNILAWIVKMAGYEATPYEEIDKDKMTSDLAKAKQDVFKALKEKGMDSEEMVEAIYSVIHKDTLETTDDAFAVIASLEVDNE